MNAVKKFKAKNKFHASLLFLSSPPLFHVPVRTTVIEKFPILEYHVISEFVKHLFWDGLVPLLGKKIHGTAC